MRSSTCRESDRNFQFDWKTPQMAIGETPSEPFAARTDHTLADDPAPSDKKVIAKIAKIAGIPKLKTKRQTLPTTQFFQSVASVKISGKNSPPDRAPVPAGTGSPVGFPAEIYLPFHDLRLVIGWDAGLSSCSWPVPSLSSAAACAALALVNASGVTPLLSTSLKKILASEGTIMICNLSEIRSATILLISNGLSFSNAASDFMRSL